MNWKEFLEKNNHNGIIRAHISALPDVPDKSVELIKINSTGSVRDENSLFNEFFVMADFGPHFGFNWNAMNDCLVEHEYTGIDCVAYLYYHYEVFRDNHPGAWNILLDIFSTARNLTKFKLGRYDIVLILVDV
jgi:hypothetical protein